MKSDNVKAGMQQLSLIHIQMCIRDRYYDIYVSSKTPFKEFEFDGYNYCYIASKCDIGIEEIMYSGGIRVTCLLYTSTALFTAIIVVMAFTPLGFIPLVVINATIIHIPVILGAIFCGPKKGAFLGFVFGLTSFIKNTLMPTSMSAFVFSPILASSIDGAAGVVRCV